MEFFFQQYCSTLPQERELVLILHNNIYVFAGTRGTQYDPDIFYVNGKPGRAVLPYRVVVKKEKAQDVIQQTERHQLAEIISSNARLIEVLPAQPEQAQQNDNIQDEDIEELVDEAEDAEEESDEDISDNVQEQVDFHADPNQPHHLEVPLPAAYQPEEQPRQQLVSQETQTELRLLYRQFLRINKYNPLAYDREANN